MTRRELEVTDLEQIREILDASKILHLGLVDDGEPYVVPMNYGYTLEDGELTLYLHGALKGYKMDVMQKNPRCCFTMECSVVPFEGKVACQYGTSYYSLMGRGTAEILSDPKEKVEGLCQIMKTQTGKNFGITEKLVSIVSVIRIKASVYTAKHRPMPSR